MKKAVLIFLIGIFFTDCIYSAGITYSENDVLSKFVLLSVFCLLVLLVLSICIIMILYSSIKRKNRIIVGLMGKNSGNEVASQIQEETETEKNDSNDSSNPVIDLNPGQCCAGDYDLFRQFDENVHKDQLYLNYNLGRDDYSRLMGVDKNRFACIIKEYGGGNLSSYLNNLRLEHSVRLLLTYPDMPVNEIASRSAFPNASTYYRLFKEKYGQSPNSYRTQSGGESPKLSVEPSVVPYNPVYYDKIT